MHYVQKYLENFPSVSNGKAPKTNNVLLYCNYYSFYSQKVLMALYEKNVEFEPVVIDITKGEQYSSWFLEINPRGEIPVLQHGNKTIPDSTRILDYLDTYLDSDSQPIIRVSSDTKVTQKVDKFRDLVDALPAGVITVGSFYHPHLCGKPKLPFVLPVREVLKSGDTCSSQNLRKYAEENPNAKATLLYKAEIQDRKHEIIRDEEEYLKILGIVERVMDEVEQELNNQPSIEGMWLCGEQFSIADISITVLLQRLWELGLEDRFWTNGKRPGVERYFEKAKGRESFKKTIPNLPYHIRMIISSQPPVYVGAAMASSIGFVLGVVYLFRKVIR